MTTTERRDAASPVQRRQEGATVLLRDATGTVRVEYPARKVVLCVVEGRQSEALAKAMSEEIDAVIAREGSAHNFCDAWAMDSHEPSIRQHWQAWASKQRAHLLSNQLLFRPKNTLATMAATVANMILGGSMKIHSTRATFDAAVAEARTTR